MKTFQQPLLQKKNELEEKKDEKENQKKKESYLFPYWCVYVGWGLAFIGIVSSSVVVILYGMVFGNSVSLEWLSSIILGFIQDIVVIQPIKVQPVMFLLKYHSNNGSLKPLTNIKISLKPFNK